MKTLLKSIALIALLGIATIAEASFGGQLKNIRIRGGGGSYRLTVVLEDAQSEIASMTGTISVYSKGAPQPSAAKYKLSYDANASNNGLSVYYFDNLNFKTDATGYEYEVSISAYDKNNDQIDETYTQTVEVNEESNANSNSYRECKTSYKMGDVYLTTGYSEGLYLINFQFNFASNSDQPESVAVAVKVADCNGNTQIVKLRVRYDSKSGTYVASVALKDNSKCSWNITDAEIGAYNACDDLSAWTVNLNQYKANGVGTRNVATASNGKPGLL
ncbi:MAG: hypothetical protein KDC92_07015 [Bacteroidetes bacterium]|nr:hypothetical protein [Bacteroidota bacterium]